MMKLRNGSITVFLCIVLAVLIPLCGILIDLTCYNEAKKIAESSLKVCAESMLAAYDTQLKEQFGLFAMYPRDVASMEREIYELLSDNLTPENADGKITDLYGFKVNRVEVIPIYNYSEPYVLEQQVTEFMKYRAPAQAIGEFLEKLKTMGGLMKEGDMIEKNMDIDKKLNDMRQNMIYLSLLLDEKMKAINEGDKKLTLSTIYLGAIKQDCKSVKDNKPSDNEISIVNDNMSKYKVADVQCKNAEAARQKAADDLKPVADAKSSLESRIASLEAQRDADKSTDNSNSGQGSSYNQSTDTSDPDSKINDLQKQLSDLMPEYSSLNSIYQDAESKYNNALSNRSAARAELDKSLDVVINKYKAMNKSTSFIIVSLQLLDQHMKLHIDYCQNAVKLIDAIIPQAEAIQTEKTELEGQINQNPDSPVSAQIGADLKKKLLGVDVGVLNTMKEQINSDENRLMVWLDAVDKAMKGFSEAADKLDLAISSLEGLKNDPGDGSAIISAYTGHDNNEKYYSDLKDALLNFESYPDMKAKGVYVVPDYTPDPLPTDKERTGFNVWYGNTFEGKHDKPPEEKDNGDLDKAKQSLAGSAANIANEVVTDSDISINNLIASIKAEFLPFPSSGGSVGSDSNLQKISNEVYNTQQEQAVSPFDAAPQGYGGAMDEKQKNFFDYELERIRSLLNAITNLLADAGESIVKSLYMNEYIVSAFNNYTTKGSAPEYDIGWDRPRDSSYFKQGEVEYVIFGNADESKNISAAKRSVFAIRLVFNLVHVYSDPLKVSQALEIAGAIAGWTIFGVPIVQNLILIGWAGLESWIDAGKLMNGESVPLVKTRQSWLLDIGTLKNYLVNSVLFQVGDFVKKKAEEAVDAVAQSLEETVTSFIDAQIDNVFSAMEKEWQSVSESIDSTAQNLVDSISLPDISDFKSDTLDDFLASLKGYIEEQVSAFCRKINGAVPDFVNDCKTVLKKKISDLVYGSDVYKNLLAKIKKLADDAINKGVTLAADKPGGLLGASGNTSSGSNNVLGRLIMTDYTDYLRLMLLAVPEQTKALRVADLMQMDMYTTAPDNCKPINKYYTALYVKAYIDMNTWLIPERLIKKDNDGMIVVEWSLGY